MFCFVTVLFLSSYPNLHKTFSTARLQRGQYSIFSKVDQFHFKWDKIDLTVQWQECYCTSLIQVFAVCAKYFVEQNYGLLWIKWPRINNVWKVCTVFVNRHRTHCKANRSTISKNNRYNGVHLPSTSSAVCY